MPYAFNCRTGPHFELFGWGLDTPDENRREEVLSTALLPVLGSYQVMEHTVEFTNPERF